MIEVYKILTGKYDPKAATIIRMREENTKSTQQLINEKPCKTNIHSKTQTIYLRKYCFTVRAVKIESYLSE